jgi:hypothetical protein
MSIMANVVRRLSKQTMYLLIIIQGVGAVTVLSRSRTCGPEFQNIQDTIDHDQTWAFKRYGNITSVLACKAWYYDGIWHDPGELKGIQVRYGTMTNDDPRLLMGARRPHFCQRFDMKPKETIYRIGLSWFNDTLRSVEFYTNRGSKYVWGFTNVQEETKRCTLQGPFGSWLAAIYGSEGKPLPPEQGGFVKRYISKLGAVWAKN